MGEYLIYDTALGWSPGRAVEVVVIWHVVDVP